MASRSQKYLLTSIDLNISILWLWILFFEKGSVRFARISEEFIAQKDKNPCTIRICCKTSDAD